MELRQERRYPPTLDAPVETEIGAAAAASLNRVAALGSTGWAASCATPAECISPFRFFAGIPGYLGA
jgi:hypothetical protein